MHVWRHLLVAVLSICAWGNVNADVLDSMEKALMPGELSAPHAKFEEKCTNCHKFFGQEHQNHLCLDCHDHKNIAEDIKKGKGYHGRIPGIKNKECRVCHSEHKGRQHSIVLLDKQTFNHQLTDFPLRGRHGDAQCKTCHKKDKKTKKQKAYHEAPTKCIKCHKPGKSGAKLDLSGAKIWTGDLTNDPDNVNAGRFWCKSYYNLTAPASRYVSFIDVNSPAEGLEPYFVGSKKSILIGKLRNPPSGMNVSLTKAEMGKICAWIDLCIPHSGFYTDDMRSEDSLHYLDRLKRREQAKLVEERNIDEFKAVGGYKSYGDAGVYRNRQTDGNRRVAEHAFNIRLSSSGKSLIVRIPGNGRMALIDMLGRTLMAYSFNNNVTDYRSNIPIRAKLPKGIYIATFKGAGLNKHTIINVQ